MTSGARKSKSVWSSATGVLVAVVGLLTALVGLGKEWLSLRKEAAAPGSTPAAAPLPARPSAVAARPPEPSAAAGRPAEPSAATSVDTLVVGGMPLAIPFRGAAGRPLLVWVRPASDTAQALMRVRITNAQGEPVWSPDPGTSWGKLVRELKEPFTPPRTERLVVQIEGVVGAARINVAVRPLT